MKVATNHLALEYRELGSEIQAKLRTVIRRGQFILGPEVRSFETAFGRFLKVPYVIGTANGLESLQLALMALGIGPGDEVITTPLSAVATALAVTAVGARVVFADIDGSSYNLDPRAVASKIRPRTKAIIPVHLYGQPADIKGMMLLARKYRLKVIEDCSQAHGASIDRRLVGSIGHVGAFSFYPSKNLGAYGDAGCVVTKDRQLAAKLRALRDYGQVGRYVHSYYGLNSRLDELQATILSVKLKHLPDFNRRRKTLADYYRRELRGLPIVLPSAPAGITPVWHQFVIRTRRRQALQAYLAKHGILTQVHYPEVIYRQQVYRRMKSMTSRCLKAEAAVKEILSLPLHPFITAAERKYIVKTIKCFFVDGD